MAGAAGAFRLQARSFFLTYPQCPLDKNVALSQLVDLERTKNLEWAIVCKESHQDGTPHLHAVLHYTRVRDVRHPRYFDLTGDNDAVFHGNYKSARNLRDSVVYVCKDMNLAVYPPDLDVEALTKTKKKATQDLVAEMVMAGAGLNEVRDSVPGFYMMHKPKVADFYAEMQRELGKRHLLPWQPLPIELGWTNTEIAVVRWLNANIKCKRAFKQKQLWLWSVEPSVGKTSLMHTLQEFCTIFYASHERYQNGFANDYDVVVFDEYKGQQPVHWMNNFLDGSTMLVGTKGGQVCKTHNMPVVILSNSPPVSVYHNVGNLSTLLSRLEVIEVPAHEPLFRVIDKLKSSGEGLQVDQMAAAIVDLDADVDAPSEVSLLGEGVAAAINSPARYDSDAAAPSPALCYGECGPTADCVFCNDTLGSNDSLPEFQ